MSVPKPYITYGFAILLILGLIAIFSGAFRNGITAPETTAQDFSHALWGNWGLIAVIIGFVIFAGGMGILALLGGEWKWQ